LLPAPVTRLISQLSKNCLDFNGENVLKKFFLAIFFLSLAMFAWAQEEDGLPPGDRPAQAWEEDEEEQEQEEGEGEEEEQEAPERKRRGIKNRTFEIAVGADVNVSNDFITAKDFFQETFVINIDDFLNGFRLDFSAAIKPLSLNFNWKDKWGFGLDFAHISVFGNVSLSGSMMNLSLASDDKFGAGAAAFVDVLGIPVFFHARDFKVKIRPAAYAPLLYTEPGITYNFDGSRLSVDYDMRVYTPISLKGILGGDSNDSFQDSLTEAAIWDILNNNLGFDLSLGLEYPLFPWLDVGADIVNLPIPFAASKLNHYTLLRDSAYVDSSKIDIGDLIDGGEIPDDAYHVPDGFEPKYGYDSDGKTLYRPFKMLFYANYRPFESYVLTLIPSLGFSINRLYPSIGAPEGGLSVRCDLANLFIVTLGINYTDRKWKNSLDLVLNFRAIELDVGVSVQSPDFARSFQGAGVGVNVGVKLGW